MEFVTAPVSGKGAVVRLQSAIPQMKAAIGKAGLQPQKARHGVVLARGVGQRLSHHHIAAAFTIDRPVP